MGNKQSVAQVEEAIRSLSNDVDLTAQQHGIWNVIFVTPTTPEILATLLTARLLRYWRCFKPNHLALLVFKCNEQLQAYHLLPQGGIASDLLARSTQAVRNALLILTRIMPIVLECPTSTLPAELITDARAALTLPDGRAAPMFRPTSKFSRGFATHLLQHNRQCVEHALVKSSEEPSHRVWNSTASHEGGEAGLFELEAPLGELLAINVFRAACIPNFTLARWQTPSGEVIETNDPPRRNRPATHDDVDPALMWTGGILQGNYRMGYSYNGEVLENRLIWLRCAVVVLSGPIYGPTSEVFCNSAKDAVLDSRRCPLVSTIIASLVATLVEYNPFGALPYSSHLVSVGESIVVSAAALLGILLDGETQTSTSPEPRHEVTKRGSRSSSSTINEEPPTQEEPVVPKNTPHVEKHGVQTEDESPAPRLSLRSEDALQLNRSAASVATAAPKPRSLENVEDHQDDADDQNIPVDGQDDADAEECVGESTDNGAADQKANDVPDVVERPFDVVEGPKEEKSSSDAANVPSSSTRRNSANTTSTNSSRLEILSDSLDFWSDSGELSANNAAWRLFVRCDAETAKSIVEGFVRYLRSVTQSHESYLPGSQRRIDAFDILAFTFSRIVTLFSNFLRVLHSVGSHHLVGLSAIMPLLDALYEGTKERRHYALLASLLQVILSLSIHRSFAMAGNTPVQSVATGSVRLPSWLPRGLKRTSRREGSATFHDAIICWLCVALRSSSPWVLPYTERCATILCNFSPYVVSVHSATAQELCATLTLMSAPETFLRDQRAAASLALMVEAMANILQYQFQGALSLLTQLAGVGGRTLKQSPVDSVTECVEEREARHFPHTLLKQMHLPTLQLAQTVCAELIRVHERRGNRGLSLEGLQTMLRRTSIVGYLPLPHPIVTRYIEPTVSEQQWRNSLLWGLIYAVPAPFPLGDTRTITIFAFR